MGKMQLKLSTSVLILIFVNVCLAGPQVFWPASIDQQGSGSFEDLGEREGSGLYEGYTDYSELPDDDEEQEEEQQLEDEKEDDDEKGQYFHLTHQM